MITNSAELEKALVAKGIKPTYPRLKILSYLEGAHEHPTADMIYQEVVKAIPTISKTTVYNTLKAFVEKGIVSSVTITGTEVRFDFSDKCHHHFLCEECGRIIDIDIVCPNLTKKEINGHQIKGLQGYFRGVCADCLGKKAK